jgi:hypothetical protein
MVGAGRVLTHPSGYASRGRWPMHGLFPRFLDIASPFTGTVLFVTRMSLIFDKNSINTIFTHIQ